MVITSTVKEHPLLFSGEMVRAILEGRKTQTRRVMVPQPPRWIDQFGFTCFTPEGHISGRGYWKGVPDEEGPGEKFFRLAYGRAGDRLWVREAFNADFAFPGFDEGFPFWQDTPAAFRGAEAARYLYYRADRSIVHATGSQYTGWEDRRSLDVDTDEPRLIHEDGELLDRMRWRPSIHMPRWASRIELEVTEVRVERLQEITEADAQAEGVEPYIVHPLSSDEPEGATYAMPYAELWDALNSKRGYGWDMNPWVWVISFRRID